MCLVFRNMRNQTFWSFRFFSWCVWYCFWFEECVNPVRMRTGSCKRAPHGCIRRYVVCANDCFAHWQLNGPQAAQLGTQAAFPFQLPKFDSKTIAKGCIDYTDLVALKDGKGGYGEVYKGKSCKGTFALKRQALDGGAAITNAWHYLSRQRSQLQAVVRESKIYFLPTLCKGSPNLARLVDIAIVTHQIPSYPDFCVEEPLLVFYWADAPNNTLRTWMHAHPISTKPELQERLSLAIQMVIGLKHLHEGDIVHQDLKPRNMVLFGTKNTPARLELTDFGMSVKFNGKKKDARCTAGTRYYMAPEQWLGKSARSASRDLWAVGMVFVEMFGGIEAYTSMQKYRHEVKNNRISQIIPLATDIARAFKRDAQQSPGSQLSIIREAIAPLVSACFRQGRELEDAISPQNWRPQVSDCEVVLRELWQNIFQFPWSEYRNRIPQPEKSPFQKYKNPDLLASLYFDLMEKVILRMMKRRCELLVHVVKPLETDFVRKHIAWLNEELRLSEKNRAVFFRKYLQHEHFAETRRSSNLPLEPPPVPNLASKVCCSGSNIF